MGLLDWVAKHDDKLNLEIERDYIIQDAVIIEMTSDISPARLRRIVEKKDFEFIEPILDDMLERYCEEANVLDGVVMFIKEN